MKRAERLEIRACALEREIGTDHLDDVVRRGDLFDRTWRDRRHVGRIFRSFGSGSDVKLTQCSSASNRSKRSSYFCLWPCLQAESVLPQSPQRATSFTRAMSS